MRQILDDLATDLLPPMDANTVVWVRCDACNTRNHAVRWELDTLPGTDHASAVVCYACDTRQHDILFSAVTYPPALVAAIAQTEA